MRDQSIFRFSDKEHVNIRCEIYSYPKAPLQLRLNNQNIRLKEFIDCLNDDLSSISLSDSLCLSQTNWRVRVRINTTLYLTREYHEQHLTCSVVDFPYGDSWHYSTDIQFIEIIGKL